MKTWMWGFVLAVCIGVVGGLWWRETRETEVAEDELAPRSAQRPPNVILFTLDTTRADHLGAYGYTDSKTPTIDALAKGGVLFRRAISSAPITLPAHSSIFTGLYPPAHGVRDNGTFSLRDDMTTLAEMLHDSGYATGAFVGAAVLERRYGLTQGFDVYDDDFSQGRRKQLFMYSERPCEQVTMKALQWLEQHKHAPFFTWLHFFDPHAAYDPPEPWATDYADRLYDGEIAYADHCIGTVVDALRSWGVWKDTLIVVTADHGESLGEHGEKTHGLFIYDATVHIPLIFHAPTHLPTGLTVDAVVSAVDIMPTTLALLGKAAPQPLDGKSLLPLMRGRREPEGRVAYSEALLPKYHYGWAELKGLTTQDWKLIDAPQAELYALKQDPKELINVLDRERPRVRELTKTLTAIAERTGVTESRLELDPETAERLRGLGYIWTPEAEQATAGGAPPDPKDMIHTHEQIQLGRELFRQDRFAEAAAAFQSVVTANPRSLSTYFDLASAYVEKGDMTAARQALDGALKLDPQHPRAYTMLGAIEGRSGNMDDAFKLLQRALEVNPRYLDAYVQLAALWGQKGELAKAEETVRQALHLVPTHTNALSRLGDILLTKGDAAGAEAALRAALKNDPYDAATHRTFGVLHDKAGRVEDALHEYNEALKTNNRLPDVHNAIGILFAKQGKLDQAEVQTKEALRLDPQYADALVSLGIIYDQKGLKQKAVDANTRAIQLDPRAYQAYGNMAVLYLRDGEYAKAEELLRKALEVKPDYPEAYNNLAVVYMDQGETKKAIAAAEQALQYRPDYTEALTNLGILYDKQGQLERALEYHRRAVAANAAHWQARTNLAITLEHLHRYAEAAEELVAVLRLQPQRPDIHKRLGDLYFEPLKDWGKARQHYEIYLRAVQQGKERQEVQARLRKIVQS
jgi:arylsulfatase A-like enzyme/Flp pilus assembly protein TadD